jgi:hypothetical protein
LYQVDSIELKKIDNEGVLTTSAKIIIEGKEIIITSHTEGVDSLNDLINKISKQL